MSEKTTDIYATSLDYDKQAKSTRRFFVAVQNKLLLDWMSAIKKNVDRLRAVDYFGDLTILICTKIEVKGVCDYHGSKED